MISVPIFRNYYIEVETTVHVKAIDGETISTFTVYGEGAADSDSNQINEEVKRVLTQVNEQAIPHANAVHEITKIRNK